MIISQESRDSFQELFDLIYKENQQASELSFMILECLHVWDDHVDQDKSVSKRDANYAWHNAMVKLPIHPIYQSMPQMPYLIQDVYFKWLAANEFELSGDNIEKAYILRAELYGVFVHIACFLYGQEHAESITAVVWRWYGEKLEEFKEEVKSCQIQ